MAKKDDAENLEPSATVLTATGDPEPNPAATDAGVTAVPYDVGGMPPRGAQAGPRTVLVLQTEGEVGVAFDGGPRKAYKVTQKGDHGTITVPAADNPARVAAVIPGARLAEED